MIKRYFVPVGLAVIIASLAQAAGAQTGDAPSPEGINNQPVERRESDINADLAERVRRNIVADRNLSSYAAKVTIVATDDEVRLTGSVQNEGEKAQIASKAAALAGRRRVVNDLRIMTNVPDGAGLRALLEQASMPRTPVAAAN